MIDRIASLMLASLLLALLAWMIHGGGYFGAKAIAALVVLAVFAAIAAAAAIFPGRD